MKKFICTMAIVVAFLFIAGCGSNPVCEFVIHEAPEEYISTQEAPPDAEPTATSNPLIFNSPEATGGMQISPAPSSDFYVELSRQETQLLFPGFSRPLIGWAFYWADGELTEVSASFSELSHPYNAEFQIGVGRPPIEFSRHIFDEDTVLQPSYVNGIYIDVLMITSDWHESHFIAEFNVGEMHYRISFHMDEEAGKTLMYEAIQALMQIDTATLAQLETPEIPELLSAEINLDEARVDEYFGKFVPSTIPQGFSFRFGHRSIRGHENINDMFLSWEAPLNQDYLYEVYTRWLEERDSERPAYSFDRVFWHEHHLTWTFSLADEHHLERVIPVSETHRYNWSLYTVPYREGEHPGWRFPDIPDEYWHGFWSPVFLAEEMTLDVVRARERVGTWIIQGADGNEDMVDVFIPVEKREFEFSVLMGDVVAHLRVAGATVEEVWTMIMDVIEN